ncbi:hypothetical protein R1sor_009723 [Riccia sorocarpa]|uniref:Endonuclease/exonuclease/phosphatase domain-containing protein n=1 Tax=Riccia sorocarpa TaxID=122646 RepID=A0ABD3HYP2_9MARC
MERSKEDEPKTTGVKHQQEDRDLRLSSVGALIPKETSGRKKLRNGAEATNGSGTAAGGNFDMMGQNSNGASDLRGRTIKGRIQKKYREVDVFALQELKTQEWNLERTLEQMVPGSRTVIDYRENGWGDSALVVKPGIQVMEVGVRGNGHRAWATMNTARGKIGLVSIYAPNNERRRCDMWNWIRNLTEEGSWIVAGDLNMVERAEDTNCASPILKGTEVLEWLTLCQTSNLTDCYNLATARRGPRFTRVQVKGTTVEMSRLDSSVVKLAQELYRSKSSVGIGMEKSKKRD